MRQYGSRQRRSANETVAIAAEEWPRQTECANVECRDTPNGRVACMERSRLPV